jgi:hypothetical protein
MASESMWNKEKNMESNGHRQEGVEGDHTGMPSAWEWRSSSETSFWKPRRWRYSTFSVRGSVKEGVGVTGGAKEVPEPSPESGDEGRRQEQ